MAVELSTIPLFKMYTVKIPKAYVNDPRYYDPIVGAVRGMFDSGYIYLLTLTYLRMLGVIAEEMLHLSLVGSVLRAVGGSPQVIPSYPMLMPGRIPDLEL